MLEFLEEIVKPIEAYRSQERKPNIFTAISDAFYRENFHSDVFAYYLSYDLAKRALIEWINDQTENGIAYDDYKDGDVKREEGRIDITLYSQNKKKAIIIENKSNDANDQNRQLPRYCGELKAAGVLVEAIIYLNKNHIKKPDTSNWTLEEITGIDDILLPAQLIGINSFSTNVINIVLKDTTDIRLCALSHEIKDLLIDIIHGGINMEDLKPFVKELGENNNLAKLQKAIIAYNDLPKYWRQEYKNYLDFEKNNNRINKSYRIGIHKDTCLFVDNIIIGKINFGFDIWFSHEFFDFSILTRNGNDDDIEKLKNQMNQKWLFMNDMEYGRYRFYYKDVFNEEGTKKTIIDVIESFSGFI